MLLIGIFDNRLESLPDADTSIVSKHRPNRSKHRVKSGRVEITSSTDLREAIFVVSR